MSRKVDLINTWTERLETERVGGRSYGDHIRRGDLEANLPEEFRVVDEPVKEEVIYRLRYKGYLEREFREIEKRSHLEAIVITERLDYQHVNGLRREGREKLMAIRPENLGQASRISGVNPADISILMVTLGRTG